MRLDANTRQLLLNLNDGFKTSTYYEGKNSHESRTYTIEDGELHIRESGQTSWADSHYSNRDRVADREETHRFLYSNQNLLDIDIDAGSRPERLTRSVIDPEPAVQHVSSSYANDDDEAAEEEDEKKIPWLPILVVTASFLVTGVVVFRYGKPVWNNHVRPAAVKLKKKLSRSEIDPDVELKDLK